MKTLLANQPLFRLLLLLAVVIISYLTFSHQQLGTGVNNADKLGHFMAFFGLSFLADRAFPSHFNKLSLPLLVLYGAAIELIQGQLPYRSASVADFIADITGIWLYLSILLLVRRVNSHAND